MQTECAGVREKHLWSVVSVVTVKNSSDVFHVLCEMIPGLETVSIHHSNFSLKVGILRYELEIQNYRSFTWHLRHKDVFFQFYQTRGPGEYYQ